MRYFGGSADTGTTKATISFVDHCPPPTTSVGFYATIATWRPRQLQEQPALAEAYLSEGQNAVKRNPNLGDAPSEAFSELAALAGLDPRFQRRRVVIGITTRTPEARAADDRATLAQTSRCC